MAKLITKSWPQAMRYARDNGLSCWWDAKAGRWVAGPKPQSPE